MSTGDNEEMNSKMTTMLRALDIRDDLWVVVTAVLPLVSKSEDISPQLFREEYRDIFEALGFSADSERDLAVITGAIEMSRWIVLAAEGAKADPVRSWKIYLDSMRPSA